MPEIDFWLRGQPVGKQRPRFANGRVYTPHKTKQYEMRIAAAASDVMVDKGYNPTTEPVAIHIKAQFEIPKSWPKWKREAATRREIHPQKPDIDNIAKTILDGLNGVAFEDDQQVVHMICEKRYGDPLVIVKVRWRDNETTNNKIEGSAQVHHNADQSNQRPRD